MININNLAIGYTSIHEPTGVTTGHCNGRVCTCEYVKSVNQHLYSPDKFYI